MLELQNIDAHYGRIQALKGVTLDVLPGEIVSLIGANGAGKSTLLSVISGLIRPSRGGVVLDRQPLTGLDPADVVRRGVIQVPEGRQLFGPLTVLENLEMGAYSRFARDNRREIARDMEEVFLLFPVLSERRRQAAGTLSGGEQQMLAIGRGLMARPRLLLLDEPSLGLAPMVVGEIFRIIRMLKERGTTILLVEQNARGALKISDRAYVLETGRVTLTGQARDLLTDQEVKRAFLGQDYREKREK
ncbi:MAG: ABC transporter ATP-binding protein [Thermodesulfobacteriota bacterium]